MKNKSIASFMIKIVMMPLLFTISCVNEISEDPVDIPGEIPIRLSTQILCNHTRAINNEFQEKDAIGVNSTLAVSNIRNRTYTNCEVYLIDYGYGNFKEKIHFME